MIYIICVAAGIIGSVLILAAYVAIMGGKRTKRRTADKKRAEKKEKMSFTKIIIILVLFTYFIGVFVGVKIALLDFTQLGVLLAFIGTPTAAAIGFYCWKAKAENIVKIKRDNPSETDGIPVDLNNIQP